MIDADVSALPVRLDPDERRLVPLLPGALCFSQKLLGRTRDAAGRSGPSQEGGLDLGGAMEAARNAKKAFEANGAMI